MMPDGSTTLENMGYEKLLMAPEHQQKVERIAKKYIRYTWGNLISWEDAAQTAHIKVLQALKQGKFHQGGAEEFYHWALKVSLRAIIDLIREDKKRKSTSLDQNIPGTDLPVSETVADKLDLLDSLERTDLILKAIEAIAEIERHYPNKGYLKLWQGRVQGKTQAQLAIELGLTQSAVSKRWKELIEHIAEALGFVQLENIWQQQQANRKQREVRQRTKTQW